MHHHRIRLDGPPAGVEAAAHDLRARGHAGAEHDFTWTATDQLAGVRELSARHPGVVVLVTTFELAGSEVEEIALRAGMVTSHHRRPVLETINTVAGLPWGSCMCENGEPLDAGMVREAARSVAAHPDFGRWHATTFFGRALLLGEALGALCCVARDGLPTPATMDAVAWLATRAACAGIRAATELSEAEMEHECAWRLTRACAHAAHEDLWAEPWDVWASVLIGCGADAIGDLSEADGVAMPDGVSRWGEVPAVAEDGHVMRPYVYGEATTGGLLSTCLQVLAQFDARLATTHRDVLPERLPNPNRDG